MKKYLLEMIKRKDLLIYLVISGLKAQYRNTYLGYFWWILDPLLMGAVYYFLRVVILSMEGENIGAFLIIGLVAWKWLSSAVKTSTKSISKQTGIITKVYLPKAIFPIGDNISQMINFIFGLAVVAIFLALYRIMPGAYVFWLPFIIIVQFLFLSAISLVTSFLCVFIKDIDNILSHFVRLWFWTSPVIWEAGRLPPEYRYIVDYNPASAIIMGYRNILMYDLPPDFYKLAFIGIFSLFVIIYMIRYYSRNEHKIVKVL